MKGLLITIFKDRLKMENNKIKMMPVYFELRESVILKFQDRRLQYEKESLENMSLHFAPKGQSSWQLSVNDVEWDDDNANVNK